MKNERFEPGLARTGAKSSAGDGRFFRSIIYEAAHGGTPLHGRKASSSARKFDGRRIGRGSVAARMLSIPGRYSGLRSRGGSVIVNLARFRSLSGIPSARDHLRYIERGSFTRDGDEGRLYSASEDHADRIEFLKPCRDDRHQFRLIVSIEDSTRYRELRPVIRRFMMQVEDDLGTRLDWIAGDHYDTSHPHTHIVIRGKDDEGGDLIMSPYYMNGGMRSRLAEMVSIDLGPRTDLEIERRRSIEIDAARMTRLDRRFLAEMDEERIVSAGGRDMFDHSVRTGRLLKLGSLGLAENLGRGRWKLDDKIETVLGQIDERASAMCLLRAALKRAGEERSLSDLSIYRADGANALTGSLIERGSTNEPSGSQFLVIDGTDGRCHFVDVGNDALAALIPKGAIVRIGRRDPETPEPGLPMGGGLQPKVRNGEVSTGVDRSRQSDATRRALSSEKSIKIHLLSVIPLEQLANHEGATWLDHELISPSTSLRDMSFGRRVRSALVQRRAFLIDKGLAHLVGDQFVCRSDMLHELERRELHHVGKRISTESGLSFTPPRIGTRIEGVYRKRVELASGRFAMIDTGLEFTLVPWKPELERARGRAISGHLERDGMRWTIGRERGLGR